MMGWVQWIIQRVRLWKLQVMATRADIWTSQCSCQPTRVESILEVPKSPDLLGEDNGRDHKLEAKHKIFLSHSGAQKSFVADLCDDLKRRDRHPFFDKLRDSLPIGEKFPDLIFKAIEQCEVGVLVLSKEFFTRSKWPMLELAAMVEENKRREPNQRIRIIPVYYDIDRDVVCKTPIDAWMKVWREWEEKDRERIVGKRINAEEWKIALEECCGPILGLRKREGMLDNRFRAQIVEAVCNKVRPETRWDDSHVKGKTRLFTEICQRIYKGAQPADLKVGVHVVGLYGMGGVGKTTACKILCNELCSEYQDKVCHVEFGSGSKEAELLQMVLRKLSDLQVERMEKLNVGEYHGYLKTHLHKDRVFLALDNVSDESDKQAESLLKANFGNGSVVLVTARSMDQLQRLGVKKENCFGMPELELEEAKSVFLSCAQLKENEVGEEFVKTCLRRCYFSMSSECEHYHPLALKVLGREVGAMIRGGKDEREVLSRIGDFNMSRRKEHPVFSILKSSFDSMLEEDKLLFLCIALDIVVLQASPSFNIYNPMEWLCMVRDIGRDEVDNMLESLKRRSLLDSFGANEYGYWKFHMHDLWREFAKEEMRVGKSGDGWRIYEGEVCRGRVDLREYPKLEAVKLRYNGEDEVAVVVQGLKHLRSLEFEFGKNVVTKEVSGLGSLERLTYLGLATAISCECIAEVGLLTNLEVVWLSGFRGDRLPDMSKLTSLRTLAVERSKSLECINLQNLARFSGLYISRCRALRSVDVSGCRLFVNFRICNCDLEELNLSFCPVITSIAATICFMPLRKLNITGCNSIDLLDELGCLKKLEELRARDCERLAMLPERTLPNLRVLDIESSKFPNGVVRNRCFPNLDLEFEEARALFLKCADVKENDVGEEVVKSCLSRCCIFRGQLLSSPGRQYVAMAVKVLGSEVGDMLRGGKDDRAVMSRMSDFSLAGDGEQSVFSILRSVFELLPEENQLLYLYIALDIVDYAVSAGFDICTPMEWLCVVLGKDRDEVEDMLESLKRRSLLDSYGAERNGVWKFYVQDLWRQFAKEEMRVGRRVYEGEVFRGRVDLRENPKLEGVKLTYRGKDVFAVDVRGLKQLRSLVLWCFNVVTTEVSGLGSLERLTYLALGTGASDECIAEIGLLTNLEVVWLIGFRGDRLPDMSKLTSLRTLHVRESESLECINLKNIPRLSRLNMGDCGFLRCVDISGCRLLERLDFPNCDLEELNLSSCPVITSIKAVDSLMNLRKLNITGCSSIQELDLLGYLTMLEELRARDCERLAMLPECTLPNLRVLDIESSKFPNVVVRSRCFPNLDLEFEEARALFLKCANVKENDVGEEVVKSCLSRCCIFRGQLLSSPGRQYVAMAVKVLGSEVGDMLRGGKDDRAVMSRMSDFSLAGDGEQSVFSILRSVFELLPEENQLLYLYVALEFLGSLEMIRFPFCTPMDGLCMVLGKDRDDVVDMLESLKRRSLLDAYGAERNGVWKFYVQDLWRQFAKEEMRVGRRVYEGEVFRGRVDLREYPKLEGVKLTYSGEDVLVVDVRGLKQLRSLEIWCSKSLEVWCSKDVTTEVSGLGSLERLIYLAFGSGASYKCIAEVGLLTNLEVVWLIGFRGDRLPDMSKLTSLRTLHVELSRSLESINLQNIPRLSAVCINGCGAMRTLDISGCRLLETLEFSWLDLEDLNLSFCPVITSIERVRRLRSLRKLSITGCSSIQELDLLGCLKKLEELRARDCERLAMLPECTLPNLRVLDIESSKFPNGVVRNRCFPNLDLEFEEARSLYLKCADVKENDVGEEVVKSCLSRCCIFRGQLLSSPGRQYVAMAVKVLGSEVGDMLRGGKDDRAVMSRMSDFSLAGDGEQSVFSILRSVFELLPEEDQLLYLYIALDIVDSAAFVRFDICTPMEWLCVVLGKDRDEVEDMLESLKRRSLLDSYGAERNGVWKFYVQDLWRQFAKEEMRVGRRVYEGEVFRGRVDLREYPKLEGVKLTYSGEDVLVVDVRGLKQLRSLEIWGSKDVTTEVSGLGSLERLTYLVLDTAISDECIAEVMLLTNLEVVWLIGFRGDRLPDMSKLTSLRTLHVGESESLECIYLQNIPRLSRLNMGDCGFLRCVDISGCRLLERLDFPNCDLEELNLSSCPVITSMKAVDSLMNLRKLNITGCSSIQELDLLRHLTMLEELRARDCERLAMLPECTLPNLRVLDIESSKCPNGVMSNRFFSESGCGV